MYMYLTVTPNKCWYYQRKTSSLQHPDMNRNIIMQHHVTLVLSYHGMVICNPYLLGPCINPLHPGTYSVHSNFVYIYMAAQEHSHYGINSKKKKFCNTDSYHSYWHYDYYNFNKILITIKIKNKIFPAIRDIRNLAR